MQFTFWWNTIDNRELRYRQTETLSCSLGIQHNWASKTNDFIVENGNILNCFMHCYFHAGLDYCAGGRGTLWNPAIETHHSSAWNLNTTIVSFYHRNHIFSDSNESNLQSFIVYIAHFSPANPVLSFSTVGIFYRERHKFGDNTMISFEIILAFVWNTRNEIYLHS